jgi:hypothetical protein
MVKLIQRQIVRRPRVQGTAQGRLRQRGAEKLFSSTIEMHTQPRQILRLDGRSEDLRRHVRAFLTPWPTGALEDILVNPLPCSLNRSGSSNVPQASLTADTAIIGGPDRFHTVCKTFATPI